MRLSVVIPAHNEEACLEASLRGLYAHLRSKKIAHEIVVVNDNSTDATESVLKNLKRTVPTLRYVNNIPPNGFGFAVRRGLKEFKGDAVAVVMADGSDSPKDVVAFYQTLLKEKVDCVFGTRFHPVARVTGYPPHKLALNRFANLFIRLLFGLAYNDVTNAFKMYRRHVIQGIQPLMSHHFNLTVELPLKAIVRGYSYAVVPNDWTNRKAGVSKLRIKEMGSRYLFIVLYCLIEKWLSRGDYHRSNQEKGPKKQR